MAGPSERAANLSLAHTRGRQKMKSHCASAKRGIEENTERGKRMGYLHKSSLHYKRGSQTAKSQKPEKG